MRPAGPRAAFRIAAILLVAAGSLASAAIVIPPTLVRENVDVLGHVGGATWDVAVDGDVLFAIGASGLQTLDVTNPAAPKPLGALLLETEPAAIDIDGAYAFVASRSRLDIIDVSAAAYHVARRHGGRYGPEHDRGGG